jgi:hypothetical protein
MRSSAATDCSQGFQSISRCKRIPELMRLYKEDFDKRCFWATVVTMLKTTFTGLGKL